MPNNDTKHPNLIFVFADQLRYSSVGYNGDEYAYTPNIDDLASQSTVLDNAVSGHPVCAPFRASLLTGKYTTSTGMVINEIRINPNHRTFAHVLNDNGYNAEYIGKWHMYAAHMGDHFNPDNSFIPPGENRLGFDRCFLGYNFHHKYYAPFAYYHKDSPEKVYATEYEPDMQVNMAIEHLAELNKEDKPFALFLSIGTPHDPWTRDNVPKEYFDRFKDVKFPLPPNYKRYNDWRGDFPWTHFLPGERGLLNSWKQVYYAMVSNLDYNIGRLVDGIKQIGLDKNTIFVFTADHGEMFGAHGRRAKNIFYDEAVRIPFIINYDGLEKGKYEGMVNTVDLMPTLLSMMNLPCPKEVEGIDKSNDLKHMTKPTDMDGVLMMGTGPTAIYADGYEWRAYRTARYTYAVYRLDHKELLFDNINDKYQMVNLAKDKKYSSIKEELKRKMYEEMERVGDEFDKNSYYKKYWVKDRKINATLPRHKDLNK